MLGVERDADEDDIRRAYRREAQSRHPDKGGTQAEWHELQAAYREGLSFAKQALSQES